MKVACGVMYVDEKNILMGLRSKNGKHPNYWEFPGGKCEENETLEECLHREWKEELNVKIKIDKKIYAWINEEQIECHFYRGKILDIENLKQNVHEKIIYAPPEELYNLRIFDGDEQVIDMLK